MLVYLAIASKMFYTHFFTDSVWPIWCPCWFWFLHDHENFKHWRYMYIHKIDSPLHNFDSCADRLSYSRLFIYLTYNLLPWKTLLKKHKLFNIQHTCLLALSMEQPETVIPHFIWIKCLWRQSLPLTSWPPLFCYGFIIKKTCTTLNNT